MERELPRQSIPGDTHTFRNDQFEVDVYRLIDLTSEIEVAEVPAETLGDQLDGLNWNDSDQAPLCPRDVIDAIRAAGSYEQAIEQHPTWAAHIEKISAADYTRPLLVHGHDIIDGLHRFAKAILDGQPSVPVKTIDTIPPEALLQQFPKSPET